MINKYFAPILTLPLVAGVVTAQSPKTQALLMAMSANGKQMAPYQWKQKVTVIRKGVPAATILEEVRFDSDGQLQRTTLSKPEEKRMGPLRARKAAQVKDSVEEVMRLAGQYANPQQLSRAIRSGEIWEGPGALRVQAKYLIVPPDEMTMLVNGSTYLPDRIDFKTRYDGGPVTIAIHYQPLPNGPVAMARMTVQVPEEDLVIQVESFGFVRLAVPAVPSL